MRACLPASLRSQSVVRNEPVELLPPGSESYESGSWGIGTY